MSILDALAGVNPLANIGRQPGSDLQLAAQQQWPPGLGLFRHPGDEELTLMRQGQPVRRMLWSDLQATPGELIDDQGNQIERLALWEDL